MYDVGMVPFLLSFLPWQHYVNLAGLSIQVLCEIAQAWWPLASAVGLRRSDVQPLVKDSKKVSILSRC